MKKISIIIPVYNTEEFLAKCLDSVVKQSIGMENLEVIAVNDGSVDGSLQILEKYAADYDNIIIINQENAGSGVARNKAITKATGEYMAFLDSDDYLPLDAYEQMYYAAEGGVFEIVCGNTLYMDTEGNITHKPFDEYVKNTKNNELIIDPRLDREYWRIFRYTSVWYKLYKTEFIKKNNILFTEKIRFQDISFTTVANLLAKYVKFINHNVYCYLQRPGSIIRSDKPKGFYLDIFKSLEETYNNITLNGLNVYKYVFDYIVLDNHLIYKDRIDAFISRTCIERYGLTSEEFNYASSVIKNILKNTSMETLSSIPANRRDIYLDLNNKLDDANTWEYHQSFSEGEVLISIIVPFYNVEKYIRACLESLENQTLKNIEVIIVDDGSPDNSFKIAKEFAEKNTNFYLYQKKNGGLGDARNFGLGYARGDYIIFLDSDDMMPPRACESLYKALIETDSDIVAGKTVWMLDNETKDESYLNKWFNYDAGVNFRGNEHFPIGFPVAWAKLYKRCLIMDNNLSFPHIIGEDVPFSVQAWYYSDKITVIPEVVHWRTEREDENNKSIMQTFNSKAVIDRLFGARLIKDFCIAHELNEVKLRSFWQMAYINAVFQKITDETDQNKAFEHLIKYFSSIHDKEDQYTMSRIVGFDLDLINNLSKEQYIKLINRKSSENINVRHKISIILPIHNVEKYLEAALRSIESQTIGISNLEVIMVNDGSTDGSRAIIDKYSEKHSNFHSIHLPEASGAAGRPRNIGMKAASGDYIMFLDPDDWYEDTACEILYKHITEFNADMGKGHFVSRKEDGSSFKHWNANLFTTPVKYVHKVDEFKSFYKLTPAICSCIFRRDFIMKNKLKYPEKIAGQDMVFVINALLLANGIFYTKTKVTNYRVRDGEDKSISQIRNISYFESMNITQKMSYELFCKHGKEEDYANLLLGNAIYYINNFISSDILKNEKLEELKKFHWFFNLVEKLDVWPEDKKSHFLIKCIIDEDYETAAAIIDYFKHSKIQIDYPKVPQKAAPVIPKPPEKNKAPSKPVIMPKDPPALVKNEAQIKLDEIYSSRSWKLIEKYKRFATQTKLGRLMRKTVFKIVKR